METRKSGGHWSWGRRGGWGRGPGCKGQPGEEGDAPPLRREGREAGRRGTRLKHIWARLGADRKKAVRGWYGEERTEGGESGRVRTSFVVTVALRRGVPGSSFKVGERACF